MKRSGSTSADLAAKLGKTLETASSQDSRPPSKFKSGYAGTPSMKPAYPPTVNTPRRIEFFHGNDEDSVAGDDTAEHSPFGGVYNAIAERVQEVRKASKARRGAKSEESSPERSPTKGSVLRLSKPLPGLNNLTEGRSHFFAELARNVHLEAQRLIRYTLLGFSTALTADAEKKVEQQIEDGLQEILRHMAVYVDEAVVAAERHEAHNQRLIQERIEQFGEPPLWLRDQQLYIKNQLDEALVQSEKMHQKVEESEARARKANRMLRSLRAQYYADLESQRDRFRHLLTRYMPDMQNKDLAAITDALTSVRLFNPDEFHDEDTQHAVERKAAALQSDFAIEREALMQNIANLTRDEQATRHRWGIEHKKVKYLEAKLQELQNGSASAADIDAALEGADDIEAEAEMEQRKVGNHFSLSDAKYLGGSRVRNLLSQLGIANHRVKEAVVGVTSLSELVSRQKAWIASEPQLQESPILLVIMNDILKSLKEISGVFDKHSYSLDPPEQEALIERQRAHTLQTEVSFFTTKLEVRENEHKSISAETRKLKAELFSSQEEVKRLASELSVAEQKLAVIRKMEASQDSFNSSAALRFPQGFAIDEARPASKETVPDQNLSDEDATAFSSIIKDRYLTLIQAPGGKVEISQNELKIMNMNLKAAENQATESEKEKVALQQSLTEVKGSLTVEEQKRKQLEVSLQEKQGQVDVLKSQVIDLRAQVRKTEEQVSHLEDAPSFLQAPDEIEKVTKPSLSLRVRKARMVEAGVQTKFGLETPSESFPERKGHEKVRFRDSGSQIGGRPNRAPTGPHDVDAIVEVVRLNDRGNLMSVDMIERKSLAKERESAEMSMKDAVDSVIAVARIRGAGGARKINAAVVPERHIEDGTDPVLEDGKLKTDDHIEDMTLARGETEESHDDDRSSKEGMREESFEDDQASKEGRHQDHLESEDHQGSLRSTFNDLFQKEASTSSSSWTRRKLKPNRRTLLNDDMEKAIQDVIINATEMAEKLKAVASRVMKVKDYVVTLNAELTNKYKVLDDAGEMSGELEAERQDVKMKLLKAQAELARLELDMENIEAAAEDALDVREEDLRQKEMRSKQRCQAAQMVLEYAEAVWTGDKNKANVPRRKYLERGRTQTKPLGQMTRFTEELRASIQKEAEVELEARLQQQLAAERLKLRRAFPRTQSLPSLAERKQKRLVKHKPCENMADELLTLQREVHEERTQALLRIDSARFLSYLQYADPRIVGDDAHEDDVRLSNLQDLLQSKEIYAYIELVGSLAKRVVAHKGEFERLLHRLSGALFESDRLRSLLGLQNEALLKRSLDSAVLFRCQSQWLQRCCHQLRRNKIQFLVPQVLLQTSINAGAVSKVFQEELMLQGRMNGERGLKTMEARVRKQKRMVAASVLQDVKALRSQHHLKAFQMAESVFPFHQMARNLQDFFGLSEVARTTSTQKANTEEDNTIFWQKMLQEDWSDADKLNANGQALTPVLLLAKKLHSINRSDEQVASENLNAAREVIGRVSDMDHALVQRFLEMIKAGAESVNRKFLGHALAEANETCDLFDRADNVAKLDDELSEKCVSCGQVVSGQSTTCQSCGSEREQTFEEDEFVWDNMNPGIDKRLPQATNDVIPEGPVLGPALKKLMALAKNRQAERQETLVNHEVLNAISAWKAEEKQVEEGIAEVQSFKRRGAVLSASRFTLQGSRTKTLGARPRTQTEAELDPDHASLQMQVARALGEAASEDCIFMPLYDVIIWDGSLRELDVEDRPADPPDPFSPLPVQGFTEVAKASLPLSSMLLPKAPFEINGQDGIPDVEEGIADTEPELSADEGNRLNSLLAALKDDLYRKDYDSAENLTHHILEILSGFNETRRTARSGNKLKSVFKKVMLGKRMMKGAVPATEPSPLQPEDDPSKLAPKVDGKTDEDLSKLAPKVDGKTEKEGVQATPSTQHIGPKVLSTSATCTSSPTTANVVSDGLQTDERSSTEKVSSKHQVYSLRLPDDVSSADRKQPAASEPQISSPAKNVTSSLISPTFEKSEAQMATDVKASVTKQNQGLPFDVSQDVSSTAAREVCCPICHNYFARDTSTGRLIATGKIKQKPRNISHTRSEVRRRGEATDITPDDTPTESKVNSATEDEDIDPHYLYSSDEDDYPGAYSVGKQDSSRADHGIQSHAVQEVKPPQQNVQKQAASLDTPSELPSDIKARPETGEVMSRVEAPNSNWNTSADVHHMSSSGGFSRRLVTSYSSSGPRRIRERRPNVVRQNTSQQTDEIVSTTSNCLVQTDPPQWNFKVAAVQTDVEAVERMHDTKRVQLKKTGREVLLEKPLGSRHKEPETFKKANLQRTMTLKDVASYQQRPFEDLMREEVFQELSSKMDLSAEDQAIIDQAKQKILSAAMKAAQVEIDQLGDAPLEDLSHLSGRESRSSERSLRKDNKKVVGNRKAKQFRGLYAGRHGEVDHGLEQDEDESSLSVKGKALMKAGIEVEESDESSDSEFHFGGDAVVEVIECSQQSILKWQEIPSELFEWLRLNLMQQQQAELYCEEWKVTEISSFPELDLQKRQRILNEFEYFLDEVLCRVRPSKTDVRRALRFHYRRVRSESPTSHQAQPGIPLAKGKLLRSHTRLYEMPLHTNGKLQIVGHAERIHGLTESASTSKRKSLEEVLQFKLPASVWQHDLNKRDPYCLEFAEFQGVELPIDARKGRPHRRWHRPASASIAEIASRRLLADATEPMEEPPPTLDRSQLKGAEQLRRILSRHLARTGFYALWSNNNPVNGTSYGIAGKVVQLELDPGALTLTRRNSQGPLEEVIEEGPEQSSPHRRIRAMPRKLESGTARADVPIVPILPGPWSVPAPPLSARNHDVRLATLRQPDLLEPSRSHQLQTQQAANQNYIGAVAWNYNLPGEKKAITTPRGSDAMSATYHISNQEKRTVAWRDYLKAHDSAPQFQPRVSEEGLASPRINKQDHAKTLTKWSGDGPPSGLPPLFQNAAQSSTGTSSPSRKKQFEASGWKALAS